VRQALLIAFMAVAVALGAVFAIPSFARGDTDMSHLKQVFVTHNGHHIAAYEQKGVGPAILLLHGFPDNHHLYDKVLPRLRGRNVVTFDFLGWGASGKPSNYNYTFAEQEGDLNAVISQLHLGPVILVASDSVSRQPSTGRSTIPARPSASSSPTASTLPWKNPVHRL
jgi:alpha/beta hydrolase fold